MFRGMPQSPNHPPFQMALQRRHGDYVRADGGSAANEIIVTGGHVGTHVDALAHVSHDGLALRRRRGGLRAVPRGLLRARASTRSRRTSVAASCSTWPRPRGRRAARGLRRHRRRPAGRSRPGRGVTVQPGDAVLVGTGWSRRWDDREAFVGRERRRPRPRRRRRAVVHRPRGAHRRRRDHRLRADQGRRRSRAAAGAPHVPRRARHQHRRDDAPAPAARPRRRRVPARPRAAQRAGATGGPVRPLALVAGPGGPR